MPGMRELNAVEPPRRGWRRWLIVGAGVTIARGAGLASRALARLYGAGRTLSSVTWAAQRIAASTSSRPGAFKTDAVVFSKETPTRRSGALSPTIIEQCGFQRSTGTATDLNLPPTLPDVTVEETTTTDLPVASAAVEAASAFSTTVSPSACI